MTSRVTDVIVDCHDLEVMVGFWSAVLGYERGHSGEGWVGIRPRGPEPVDADLRARPLPSPVSFVLVPEDKVVKNRVYLDIAPYDCTQQEEVARLIGLGAREADIGQRDTRWVVMADPEGNEFCVMPALDA